MMKPQTVERISCSALVVDDSESDRYILRRLLKNAKIGDEVIECAGGREALALLESGARPDLVFLDVNMPTMTGFEFLDAFVASGFDRTQPATTIIMCTSSSDPTDRARAAEFAFVGAYMVKMPKSSTEFRTQVEGALVAPR